MKLLYNTGYWFIQTVAAIATMIVLYVSILIFGVLLPHGGINQGAAEVEIFVKSNGIHTDITMPVETDWYDWKNFIPIVDYQENKTFEYISIGWGDKGFFIDTPEWSDLTTSTLLTAMFIPSECAMHVEYMDEAPNLSEDCFAERISSDNYLSLIDYVQNTFIQEKEELLMFPNASYWGTDHFYKAKGSYHLLNTCNSWTNGGLKTAGLGTALYSFFPDGIMNYRN